MILSVNRILTEGVEGLSLGFILLVHLVYRIGDANPSLLRSSAPHVTFCGQYFLDKQVRC